MEGNNDYCEPASAGHWIRFKIENISFSKSSFDFELWLALSFRRSTAKSEKKLFLMKKLWIMSSNFIWTLIPSSNRFWWLMIYLFTLLCPLFTFAMLYLLASTTFCFNDWMAITRAPYILFSSLLFAINLSLFHCYYFYVLSLLTASRMILIKSEFGEHKTTSTQHIWVVFLLNFSPLFFDIKNYWQCPMNGNFSHFHRH